MHLLDGHGDRIAGFDTELNPNVGERTAVDAFFSRHTIELPAATEAGKHDLLVGIYYFDEDELVAGSKALLPEAVDAP